MSAPRSSAPYLNSPRKIRMYSSLGGEKKEFIPIDTSSPTPVVRMYCCGLTPYDHPHIGHASAALRFDILRRYLTYRNLNVLFQTNVTDVDDKIINRAQETGETPSTFTEQFTKELFDGLTQLRAEAPTYLTKVTEMIPQIIRFIEGLIEKNFAYATASGNVYFDISKKSDYGKLSGQKISELLSGTRDREPDPEKHSPLDFALWKRDESVLSYDSKWGRGRPGWHIECSAMIHETLGERIDIHGGGLDLKFPHHENEIAQSEGHNNGAFVNFWAHAGLLTINGTKMSKSLGNYFTLNQALERFGGELIRFVMLRHHYRSEIGFADAIFRENLNSLCDLYKILDRAGKKTSFSDADYGASAEAEELIAQFEESMDNDFQTASALVSLSEAAAKVRKMLDTDDAKSIAALAATIRGLGQVLGLFEVPVEQVLTECLRFSCVSRNQPPQTVANIQAMIAQRQAARAAKDFATSDKLRDEFARFGVEVLDLKNGSPDWRFTA